MFRYLTMDFECSYSDFVKQLSCRSVYPTNYLYLVPDPIDQGDPSAVLRTVLHAISNQDPIPISPNECLPDFGTYFVLGESIVLRGFTLFYLSASDCMWSLLELSDSYPALSLQRRHATKRWYVHDVPLMKRARREVQTDTPPEFAWLVRFWDTLQAPLNSVMMRLRSGRRIWLGTLRSLKHFPDLLRQMALLLDGNHQWPSRILSLGVFSLTRSQISWQPSPMLWR